MNKRQRKKRRKRVIERFEAGVMPVAAVAERLGLRLWPGGLITRVEEAEPVTSPVYALLNTKFLTTIIDPNPPRLTVPMRSGGMVKFTFEPRDDGCSICGEVGGQCDHLRPETEEEKNKRLGHG